jgi:hypothetical protein
MDRQSILRNGSLTLLYRRGAGKLGYMAEIIEVPVHGQRFVIGKMTKGAGTTIPPRSKLIIKSNRTEVKRKKENFKFFPKKADKR